MLEKIFPKYFLSKAERKNLNHYLSKKHLIDPFLELVEMETHLPVLHQIKQNNILKYQQKHHYHIFVETGTYLGDMLEAQRRHFDKLISVELSKELYEKALLRFEKYPHIQILLGDSGKVLKKVLSEIQQPALFWLDGHYSSGITAKSDKNTPIVEELILIFQSSLPHGILVDDARLFTGKEDYPSIPEVCDLVRQYTPERTLEVADDIIRIMPGSGA